MSSMLDAVETVNYNTLAMYHALIEMEFDIVVMEPLMKRLMEHLKTMPCSKYPRRPDRWYNLISDFCIVKQVMLNHAFVRFVQDAVQYHKDPVKQVIMKGVIEHSYPVDDHRFLVSAKVPTELIMQMLLDKGILTKDHGRSGRMYFNWRLRC